MMYVQVGLIIAWFFVILGYGGWRLRHYLYNTCKYGTALGLGGRLYKHNLYAVRLAIHAGFYSKHSKVFLFYF